MPPAATKDDDDQPVPEPSPEVKAINNAYDACGIMTSKTHQDVHLETIKRTGLATWQLGWAAALAKSKHNIPAYVARCAETAMLAAQRDNGSTGKNGTAPALNTADALRDYYTAGAYADIIES
jgi:hypothetical protein